MDIRQKIKRLGQIIMVISLVFSLFSYRVIADDDLNGTGNDTADTNSNDTGEQKKDENPNEPAAGQSTDGTQLNDSPQAGTGNGEETTEPDAGNDPDGTEPASGQGGGDNEETPDETAEPADTGDFEVSGDEQDFFFDAEKGVLYIYGDVSVKNKAEVEQTGQTIIVSSNAELTLAGINIKAAKGPAILIESPYDVTLVLADDSINTVIGANGKNINATSGDFAGIEVEFEFEDSLNPANRMASLTIEGNNGVLNAESNMNGAGIGGSNSAQGSKGRSLYGNITINGGVINATSPGAGAGIGSANNPNGGTSVGSFKTTGYNTWGTITINGGTVTAIGKGEGAGIGGGNHVDSGKIIINGGNITANGAAGIGCGIGSSKNKADNGADKGPGYYWADIEINGGTIEASSNDIGAAIGGGMYCDAVIKITENAGETRITAIGGSRQGNTHHGGAGIGGGYLGHGDVTIEGGTIEAVGGDGAAGIGSGGSPNSNPERGVNGRAEGDDAYILKLLKTSVVISGGDIIAKGGSKGGAGIGLGTGGNDVYVKITGGNILAEGAKSSEEEMRGGAGIGSGYYGLGSGSNKYFVQADVEIHIEGEAKVRSIGGWGAAGIGSGADNKTAGIISIDVAETGKTFVEAYADGTKFAIDTRDLQDDGSTKSITEGRSYDGDYLQGTFVHEGQIGDYNQNPEGLKSIIVTNDVSGWSKELTYMPDEYRSFATSVVGNGSYTVYTDEASIGRGEGRYFNVCLKDVYAEEEITGKGVKYTVETDKLSDNFYLFPVKSIVVEKIVEAPENLRGEINTTAYFALNDGNDYFRDDNGQIVYESIDIVEGVAQGKAYFVDIPDKSYNVLEVNGPDSADPTASPKGSAFGSTTLKAITTQHGKDLVLNDSEASADGLSLSMSYEGDKVIITVTKDEATLASAEQSLTISLYADGKLVAVEDNPVKLNKQTSLTYTWTLDRDVNNTVRYSVKDTSNNATISKDQWTDEIRIINTYEGEEIKTDLLIRKIVPLEYKFENYSSMTAIFRITINDASGKQIYENYAGFDLASDPKYFDADKNAYVYEKILKDIPYTDNDILIAQEVYSAGYDPKISDIVFVEGEAPYYLIEAVNEYDEFKKGTGAINTYTDKTYKESAVHELLDVTVNGEGE